jgi:hypothetical protein
MINAAASFPGESNKVYISNHSYGILAGWFYASWLNPWSHRSGYHWWGNLETDTAEEYFGQYGLGPSYWDDVAYDAPYYLIFKAAGNEREDGRIKPDIVANGQDVYSLNYLNTQSYAVRSGTSMSTPNACGSAALLVDYYVGLHAGQAMRASTLKGLILHTADDLGRPGPDYQYGWGLMNTLAAAELLKAHAGGDAIRLQERLLSTAAPNHAIEVMAVPGDPIRVTICWTDPPGSYTTVHDSRTPVLVNDLDLKLIGPDGTNLPYSLSYLLPELNAVTNAENRVDNVEQVFIGAPTPGAYTILVDFDGGLSGGQQWYSLMVDGLSYDLDADGLPDSWELFHFAGGTGMVASADFDNDGYDNYAEYVAGIDPTDPNSVFEVKSYGPVLGGRNGSVHGRVGEHAGARVQRLPHLQPHLCALREHLRRPPLA